MKYSFDKFLIIGFDDLSIHIRSDDGQSSHTISAFNISVAFCSNNILKIKESGSDTVIEIPFASNQEAKDSLKKFWEQVEIVREKTPFIYEKSIKNIINGISLQGNTGPQGFGPTGLQGFQGSQGSTGFGFQGFQGRQGFQGSGSTGLQGFQGNIGSTGLQGNFGPQGFQGNSGPTGLQGSTGLQGFRGFQGNSGTSTLVPGPTGLQGFQGPGSIGIILEAIMTDYTTLVVIQNSTGSRFSLIQSNDKTLLHSIDYPVFSVGNFSVILSQPFELYGEKISYNIYDLYNIEILPYNKNGRIDPIVIKQCLILIKFY